MTSGSTDYPEIIGDEKDDQGRPIVKTGCFLGQLILLGAAGMPGGESYDSMAQMCTSSLTVRPHRQIIFGEPRVL